MKVVALISGGKDSCYSMMKCVTAGHEIVALANLQPEQQKGELDSYMFQTVGHEGIYLYAEAMGLPLYQGTTKGLAITKEMAYYPCAGDEVEDLYQLLLRVKQEVVGGVEGVASGAILSDYQRLRVESVCARLGLVSLAYLWRRDQTQLLREMVKAEVEAVVIKVAAMGLTPEKHLGKTIQDLYPELCLLRDRYGINVCGEGGEYETFTLDCPLFKKRIIIAASETVIHSADAFAPVAYLRLSKLQLKGKDLECIQDQAKNLSSQDVSHKLCLEPAVSPVKGITQAVELDPFPCNTVTSAGVSGNLLSWLRWTGDGRKRCVEEQTRDLFARFGVWLNKSGCDWMSVVLVYLLIADMNCYSHVNQIYIEHFTSSPPARVCVGLELPPGVFLQLDALVLPPSPSNHLPLPSNLQETEVGSPAPVLRSMHVQSLSEWAPANIGPYSQAFCVGPLVFLAGQIGLDPASMQLVSGSLSQAKLSLRHSSRVLLANHSSFSSALCGTCYYTTADSGESARQSLAEQQDKKNDEEGGVGCQVMFLCVSSLPRSADVEWHFLSLQHPHTPTYWRRGDYVEGVGMLSVQESWCEALQTGAWQVEAGIPYWHYRAAVVSIKMKVESCLEQLHAMLHQHALSLDHVTCVNIYLPRLGAEHSQALIELKMSLKENFQVSSSLISVNTTSELWDISRRVIVQALKLSSCK